LQLFDDEIDDLIDFVQIDDIGFEFEARNIDEARIRGVELGYALGLDPWHLQVGATFQDPEDELTGDRLLRRAREIYTASVDATLRRAGNRSRRSRERRSRGLRLP
jgi:vitamin B12 transporter